VGKGRTYSRGHEKDTKEATREQLATGKRSTVVGDDECACEGGGVRVYVWAVKMDGMHAPLFVTINNPRRHSADVRAGANKQENDEKEGLEVEQRGLRSELVAMKQLSVGSNYKTQGQKKDTYHGVV